MGAKILFLIISYISASSCCSYSRELNSAVCYSIQAAFLQSEPHWTSLVIKNPGNLPLMGMRRIALQNMPNLAMLVVQGLAEDISKNALQGLTSLQHFELKDNNIEYLPSTLFQNLPSLSDVYIISDGITSIFPRTFQIVPSLRALTIRNNTIRTFPADVVSSTNIQELHLEDNHIEQIEPLAFVNMPQLRKLSLLGNKLITFDIPLLLGSISLRLERLCLAKNILRTLKGSSFALLPNLRYLFLEMNQLAVVERGAFDGLDRLVGLDISNNMVRELAPDVFPSQCPLRYLQLLFMHNNRLTFLRPQVFDNKPALRFATYYGNPFQCTCYDAVKILTAKRNVSQVCNDNADERRPICVFRGRYPKACKYDLEGTANLHEEYVRKSKNTEPWTQKCLFAEGYDQISWANDLS